jgi:hypothetical protein
MLTRVQSRMAIVYSYTTYRMPQRRGRKDYKKFKAKSLKLKAESSKFLCVQSSRLRA